MSLLTQASLVLTPNAVKASKLYSIIPSNGNGDMTVVRATTATRVNSSGLIESVASNVPRLNYDESCPSILIEPQRTNLVPYSEMFADSSWIKTNSATVTANVDISPAGTLTADRLTAGATLSQIQNGTTAVVSGSIYTVSIWIKRISGTGQVYLRAIENINTPITITNDWVRYSVTVTASSTIGRVGVALQTSGDVISIWGAQLELGAYLTSYIPTVANSVTRNADIINKTGISNLIGQTEGTLFCDLRFTNVNTEKYIITITDTSGTNVISLRMLAGGAIRSILTATTSSGTTNQSSAVIPIGNYKLAYTYKSGSLKLFINGVLSFTLTPTFTFGTPLSIIRVGMDSTNSLQLGDSIKSMKLYKTALTDSECIALTTL